MMKETKLKRFLKKQCVSLQTTTLTYTTKSCPVCPRPLSIRGRPRKPPETELTAETAGNTLSIKTPRDRDQRPPANGGWSRQRSGRGAPPPPHPCPTTSTGTTLPVPAMSQGAVGAAVPAAPMRISRFSRARASFTETIRTEAIRPPLSVRKYIGR